MTTTDTTDKTAIKPLQDEIALAMAFLDCRPHTAQPLARLIASARLKERERCANIAHERGLKSRKDFRWMAEEIETEIRRR